GDAAAGGRRSGAWVGERRELLDAQARVSRGAGGLGIGLARMAAELGDALTDAGEDPLERGEIDVAFVLEIAPVAIDGADASRAQAIALRVVVGPDGRGGLGRDRADGPLQRRVDVQPVMRIEVRRVAAKELARACDLGAVLTERRIAVGASGPEE